MEEAKVRLEELIKALGNKYDSHSMVEAITFNETAPGRYPNETQLKDYFKNLVYILEKVKTYFPHTNVIQFANSPIDKLDQLTQGMIKAKIGLGGPDTFSEDKGLLRGIYTYYPKFSNLLPVTPSVQPENYLTKCFNCPPDPPTPKELYEFAKTKLYATQTL